MRIILGRHARSRANESHAAYGEFGDAKVPLAEEGWKQAIEAGKFLKKYLIENPYRAPKPVSFFDSPLQCVKQCFNYAANIISPAKKMAFISTYLRCGQTYSGMALGADEALSEYQVRTSPLLIEQNFGLNSYIDKSEHGKGPLAAAFEIFQRMRDQDRFTAIPPGGESPAQMMPRMYEFCGKLMREKENGYEDFIVETHGTTLRLFALAFLKIDPALYDEFINPENGSLYVIEGGDGVPYTFKQIYDGEKMQEVDIDWGKKLRIHEPVMPPVPDHIRT